MHEKQKWQPHHQSIRQVLQPRTVKRERKWNFQTIPAFLHVLYLFSKLQIFRSFENFGLDNSVNRNFPKIGTDNLKALKRNAECKLIQPVNWSNEYQKLQNCHACAPSSVFLVVTFDKNFILSILIGALSMCNITTVNVTHMFCKTETFFVILCIKTKKCCNRISYPTLFLTTVHSGFSISLSQSI